MKRVAIETRLSGGTTHVFMTVGAHSVKLALHNFMTLDALQRALDDARMKLLMLGGDRTEPHKLTEDD